MELPLVGPITPIHKNDGLYGAFRDALPDFWGRLVLEKRLGISMEAILREMAEQVGNWREFFAKAGVSEEDIERFTYTFDSPQRENALRIRADQR